MTMPDIIQDHSSSERITYSQSELSVSEPIKMAAAAVGGSAVGGKSPVTSDEEAVEHAIESDPDLQEIAARLDSDVTIDPDRELNVDTSDAPALDSDTASNASSLRDNDDHFDDENSEESPKRKESIENGGVKNKTDKQKSASNGSSVNAPKQQKPEGHSPSGSKASLLKSSDTDSLSSKKGCAPPARKNPLKMLKKLTKFDKSDKSHKKPDYRSEFSAVVVDKLPQVFVAKYLGHRQVTGVCGLHHVRKPVDEMVKAVKTKIQEKTEVEMPLLYIVVSPRGLDLREHKSNKVKGEAPLGVMPIDFISYGVQDIKYWRVFTCIVVRELSSRSRTATCHAFLCDSAYNGRKMALALGAAFSMHSKNLKAHGKVHNFQVELRPPDELADAVNAEFEA